MSVLDHAVGESLDDEERAAAPLSGGIANFGYQCGMLWGAALAAGVHAFYLSGAGVQSEIRAVVAAQRLAAMLRERRKHINCRELTGVDFHGKLRLLPVGKMLVTGKPLACFFSAGPYAVAALEEINAALNDKQDTTLELPVSCSAMMARKIGASDKHATIAAGLAGGIGLEGAGCGALGAAVWLAAVHGHQAGDNNKTIMTAIVELITTFRRSVGDDFTCAAITGRRFKNLADHAGFLRNGGCDGIIESLAEVCVRRQKENKI